VPDGRRRALFDTLTSLHCPIWLLTMDIIQHCLSLAPVPYLAPAFTVFKFIWSSVQQAQASKQQLEVLTQSIAQLLKTLDGEYRARRLLPAKTLVPFDDLCRFVRSTTPWALTYNYIKQALERNLSFRDKGSFPRISPATIYQGSEDISN
jgi:hypothetical protein